MNRRLVYWIGMAGTGLTIFAAVVGLWIVPAVVRLKIIDTVAIRKDTEAYGRWKELPLPMLFKIKIFEVMNPKEITQYGHPPVVRERGPFVYKETRDKLIMEMDESKNFAEYLQMSKFEFDPELSAESDDVEVTVVNVPAVSFAHIAESLPGLRSFLSIFNDVIGKMWPGDPIFVKVKVRDYLFNGINMLCHGNDTDIVEAIKWKGMCLAYNYIRPKRTVEVDDGEPGLNTFSFFKYKTKPDGPYWVKLGIGEAETIGEIQTWERRPDLGNMWGGRVCNRLSGTDSTVFRPFLHDVDSVAVFNSDICRSLNLTYHSTTEYKGVTARRYVASRDAFASVDENPDAYCFCPRSVKGLTTSGGCLRSGVLDLSSCQGAPVILSLPHFLHADPFYQHQAMGLSPNESQHQIFVDLEPYTGYPLRGASRGQMNIFLKRIPELDTMKNFPDKLIPLLWLDEGVELTDELVDEVKGRLLRPLLIADVLVWVMVGVGGAMTVGSFVCMVVIYVRERRS